MKTLDFDNAKYEESFLIGSFDTDLNGNAKLTSICNYLQEIAGKHIDTIHEGVNNLQKQNMTWVLSRLKIHISQFPRWKEKITIQTWATGTEGPFGNRDFIILNDERKTIAVASSSWLVIRTDTKTPVRPKRFVENLPNYNGKTVFKTPLKKLKPKNEFDFKESIKIHYSDIDINQHVNNVKYIKWVIDACPMDKLTKNQITELQINFLHESKLTAELNIFRNKLINGTNQFVIKNDITGIEHCHAIIKWN